MPAKTPTLCVSPNPKRRKCHNDEAGYVCQIAHPYFPGAHVVIYDGGPAGMDTDGGKLRWQIVCEVHGEICAHPNLPGARTLMKTVEFCEECMAIHESKGAQP